MDVNQHHRFLILDRSYLNIVKRDITKLAESYGFNETEIGKINIVVAEMISNLVKHAAEGGEILVKATDEKFSGIEIICLDRGPGLSDPEKMMEDGYSTAGTAGQGLGAIIRQSTFFDYYSQPELGTVLLSRILKPQIRSPYLTYSTPKPDKLEIGAVMVAKTGETLCGDGWHLMQSSQSVYLAAFDGLGHGPDANLASRAAIESFEKHFDNQPNTTLREIHATIRRTRGAVGSIVSIPKNSPEIHYCGIGNINGKIFSSSGPKSVTVQKNLVSYNGILGHNIPNTVNTQSADLPMGRILVLHSDGIKSRWDMAKYPELHRHDPSLMAAVIYRDFNRGTDDTLVIVAKVKS